MAARSKAPPGLAGPALVMKAAPRGPPTARPALGPPEAKAAPAQAAPPGGGAPAAAVPALGSGAPAAAEPGGGAPAAAAAAPECTTNKQVIVNSGEITVITLGVRNMCEALTLAVGKRPRSESDVRQIARQASGRSRGLHNKPPCDTMIERRSLEQSLPRYMSHTHSLRAYANTRFIRQWCAELLWRSLMFESTRVMCRTFPAMRLRCSWWWCPAASHYLAGACARSTSSRRSSE